MKTSWIRIFAAAAICAVAIIIVINSQVKSSEFSPEKGDTVLLTIAGQVHNPGTYTIKRGSSLFSNSHLFGGFTTRADIIKVDINAPIDKDMTISIKSKPQSQEQDIDSLYQMP